MSSAGTSTEAAPEHTWRAALWCTPGRIGEALDLLHELDDFSWSVAELLDQVDPDNSRWSVEILWWWQAATLFNPVLARERTARRLLYTQVDLSLGYSDLRPIERACNVVSDTVLVSSCRADGVHQPALDIDYPARLGRIGETAWLWLEPASPALDYHGAGAIDWADAAMAALGLERCSRPAATHWLDLRPHGRAVAGLAAAWQQDFETLLDAAAAVEHSELTPVPEGGVWYQVHGNAWLIPSTSWWHLYLDRELPRTRYLAAVDAAAACGLLNPGFANACRDRGYTSLRRPGLHKPPKSPTAPEDIPF